MRFRYLTLDQIIKLNKDTVEAHGGNFVPPSNLLKPEVLEYLMDAVPAEMFGEPLYPTIAAKAAVYLNTIVSGHVFSDGNKRTGLGAALVFCSLNGYEIGKSPSEVKPVDERTFPSSRKQQLYNFTIAVASGELELAAITKWFEENLVLLNK